MERTQMNNFCRVFELPGTYPSEYCFGGGHPVTFMMVDWFNPLPPMITSPKEERLFHAPWNEVVELLRPWLLKKTYIKPDRQYLLITDFGECFIFQKGNERASVESFQRK